MNVFDIKTPEEFFNTICTRFDRYQSPGGRDTADLLYVIMGLSHLRDWIAPNDWKKFRPGVPIGAQNFHGRIFDSTEFQKLLDITNGTKHLRVTETRTSVLGGSTVDEWQDFDAVLDVDFGDPTGHLIDDLPAEACIKPIIAIYRGWFEQAPSMSPLTSGE